MKVALYLRVSTDEQTVEPQRDELRVEAARRRWDIAIELEDKISGAKFSRAGLDQLMKLVRAHSIEAVICAKLDRLGRSLQHLAQIIDEFDTHGVALVCPSQGIDTSGMNPAGRLQMHILAAIAEYERALIRERTKAGLKSARARGAKPGRPKLALPANHEDIVRRWRTEHEGKSYRTLAKMLGIKNPGTALRIDRSVPAAE